jgi:glyoxylase-like metal-dependent hydrolase (beta-lactamase superfamily II)
MKEIYPNIFLIRERGSFGNIKPTINIYIIAGKDGLIFDAGFGNKGAIKHFIKEVELVANYFKSRDQEFSITRVIPSHCHPDHFSGLMQIRKKTGAKILLTKKMAEIIKNKKGFMKSFSADGYNDYFILKKGLSKRLRDFFELVFMRFLYKRIYGLSYLSKPDELIEEDCTIESNGEEWHLFPTPGHAIDHVSLYNEKKGILLSGDNILKSITTWLGPPNCDIKEYVHSLEIIHSLPNLKVILPAHGDVIENPKERIEEILNHREDRTRQLMQIVQEHSEMGISPSEIIEIIYPNEKRMLREIARGWVCLTLKMLEKDNQVRRIEEDRVIKFFPSDKI